MVNLSRILIFIILSLCLVACSSEEEDTCPFPPQSISESDIAGTWATGLSTRHDTLIFREDGRYKQILHITEIEPAFDYESDWQRWWVEYSDSGRAYVHLEGMRMCVYYIGIDCEQVGGGDTYWRDFCRDQWIQTPGEGVLIAMGTPEGFNQPPRGFRLFALGLSIEGGTAYELSEP